MRTRTLLMFPVLLMVLILSASRMNAAGIVSEAEPLNYTLEELVGDATIFSKGTTQERSAQEGDTLVEGDEIRVGMNGEAVLFLNEDTVIHLTEKSTLVVGQLTPSDDGGFLNRLKLMAGRVLAEVKNLNKSHSTFEVESGGVVCGVRGTAFEVSRSGDDVETATYEGVVEVKSSQAVERVKAGYRLGMQKQRVRLKSRLDKMDKERFDQWQKHRSNVREKFQKRTKKLRSMRLKEAEKKRRSIQRPLQRRKAR